MAKTPDRYLAVHPWKIVEEGFHPERSRVSESLFSLANEYQGVRGYFEEGYSGDTLRGCYLNGIYEEHRLKEPLGYRGIPRRIRFMVNTVDWLHTRIEADGEVFDLAASAWRDFRRELDLASGVLCRRLLWRTRSGKELSLEFGRLLSMRTMELGVQRLSITSLGGPAAVSVTLGVDLAMVHECYGECFWESPRRIAGSQSCAILGVSKNLGQKLFAGFTPPQIASARTRYLEADLFAGCRLELALEKGKEQRIDRASILSADRGRTASQEEVWQKGMRLLDTVSRATYAEACDDNRRCWASVWKASDVAIDGDPEAQQGIRFCIFQLHQTCRGSAEGSSIGAKGLTGEAYNGHAFWDTETYCLPHYLFTNPRAARSLIEFRHRTLPQALERARELDCAGACFPVATIDGSESCTLWQHANLQLQPTTGVAYAIRHYNSVVGDREFLYGEAAELLIDICRFLASRVQRTRRGFGYYGVMGPDEFHLMVNNNCYTNYMARETLRFTLEVLGDMERESPDRSRALLRALECTPEELGAWRDIAERMIIPRQPRTGLFEQHDGYFDLPHVDVESIPDSQFPLYAHWSYDRIFRSDMIKQPDVLMLMLLFNRSFTASEKSANYAYYRSRCIHESSLSPSVHSILASELGRDEEAFAFFNFATRIDLDNYNRNTAEGLHMTSIAAAWMSIVYGFGGLRSDGEGITLDPRIPKQWSAYRFHLTYRGSVIRVDVDHALARIALLDGAPVTLAIRGEAMTVSREGVAVAVEDTCSPSK
jgi:maltose phosphorylase